MVLTGELTLVSWSDSSPENISCQSDPIEDSARSFIPPTNAVAPSATTVRRAQELAKTFHCVPNMTRSRPTAGGRRGEAEESVKKIIGPIKGRNC